MKGLYRNVMAVIVIVLACVVASYIDESDALSSTAAISYGCELVAVSLLCTIAGGLFGYNFNHKGPYPYLLLIIYIGIVGVCVAAALTERFSVFDVLTPIIPIFAKGQMFIYALGFFSTFYLASNENK